MTRSPSSGPSEDPLLAEYLAKRGNLVRFLAVRSGSLAVAEDLAQDLYVKLASRTPGEEIGNPTGLLYRMAINLVLDRARGATRAAARDAAWRALAHTEFHGQDIADQPPAEGPGYHGRVASPIRLVEFPADQPARALDDVAGAIRRTAVDHEHLDHVVVVLGQQRVEAVTDERN